MGTVGRWREGVTGIVCCQLDGGWRIKVIFKCAVVSPSWNREHMTNHNVRSAAPENYTSSPPLAGLWFPDTPAVHLYKERLRCYGYAAWDSYQRTLFLALHLLPHRFHGSGGETDRTGPLHYADTCHARPDLISRRNPCRVVWRDKGMGRGLLAKHARKQELAPVADREEI
ncbi:hypothetical protein DPEC_G00115940 [Dallia pectoralis]|uniref:Uncharacterized protein n=1 Tax=Dallia pectoralis TaxID=75939 RepID=A0ACC2GUD3_DALPE|nr:hypothetical protein DPEC_G00115940 [Dallia pectoralis]